MNTNKTKEDLEREEDAKWSAKFGMTSEQVRAAVAKMLEEAHKVATWESQNYYTFEEVFGADNPEPTTPTTSTSDE